MDNERGSAQTDVKGRSMKRSRAPVIVVAAATWLAMQVMSAGASVPEPTGQIVFSVADRAFTNEQLGLIQSDGSHGEKLTHKPGFSVSAAWSPDGRRIAFTSSRSMPPGFEGDQQFYAELYVMNADGSHVRRITFNEGLIDYQPAWSPDGQRIVVARGPNSPPPDQLTNPTDLWIIDLCTGREQQLTNRPATYEGFAHWSPDGRRIAFEGDISTPGGYEDVYTISVDGTGLKRLTTEPGDDRHARYSPDGKSIVFSSDRTGNFDIFVMRTDGTHVRQLTYAPSYDVHPSYSPDGQFISFDSDRDDPDYGDIYRMRADGTQQTALTRSRAIEFDPEWQPNRRSPLTCNPG